MSQLFGCYNYTECVLFGNPIVWYYYYLLALLLSIIISGVLIGVMYLIIIFDNKLRGGKV